jgi:hypothetical protein
MPKVNAKCPLKNLEGAGFSNKFLSIFEGQNKGIFSGPNFLIDI